MREEDHVADAFLAEEHHAQAVNADADAARRGHAVFERDEEIFVQLLLLAAGLMFQRGALRDGIVLLGVAGRNLLAVDAALEDFDGRRVVGRKLGERHEFLRQMRDERGLDERRLDQFFEHRAGDFVIHVFLADLRAEIVRTLAALTGYFYAVRNESLFVNFYGQSEGEATVAAIRALGVEAEAIRAPLGNMAGLRELIAAVQAARSSRAPSRRC